MGIARFDVDAVNVQFRVDCQKVQEFFTPSINLFEGSRVDRNRGMVPNNFTIDVEG